MSSSTRGSLPKPVLNSPAQLEAASESSATSSSNSAQMDNWLTKLLFPEELDKSQKQVKKEEHKKRLQNLRKELDYINSTNWQFTNNGGIGNTTLGGNK
jgi:hypothetical protein